jgi:hypothetical protein
MIVWKDREPTGDSLLKKMAIRLREGGASGSELTPAADSKPRRMTFDVPDSVTALRLEVVIPSPAPFSAPANILDMFQEVNVGDLVVDGKTTRGLTPTTSSRTKFPSHPHPRLRVTAPSSPGFSGFWVLELDVRFLNITNYAESLVNRGFGDFSSKPHKCKWFILQHTLGTPLIWAVGVPQNVDPEEFNVNALLFFQHELQHHLDPKFPGRQPGGPYTSAENLDYNRLSQYADQPVSGEVGRYIGATGLTVSFENYPNFGWDAQLNESGKPVVFVFPFPQGGVGTDFGVCNGASGADSLFRSLFCALQSDDIVAGNTEDPTRLKRLAIGGWSSGMETVMSWIDTDTKKTGNIVDEIYMFDPQTDVAKRLEGDLHAHEQVFRTWLGKKPRMLRMIGTAYGELQYNQIAAALSGAFSNVTVRPNDTSYWYTDPVYQQALTKPGDPVPPRFDPSPPPTTAASTLTNVFFGSEKIPSPGSNVSSLRLGSPGLKPWTNDPKVSSTIAHVEAASLALFKFMIIATDQHNFDKLTNALQSIEALPGQPPPKEPNTIQKLRHPWSVMGGVDGVKGTGKPFKGFFQLCLEDSGF